MKYLAVVEKGRKTWGAHVPDLPGCIAVGQSKDEVVQLIKEAIDIHIRDLRAQGEPIPAPSSEGAIIETDAA
jgi:predicted RNase H-like HicB family nuclease